MRPGRAADHSSPSSTAVMEEQSYTSTYPLGHTGPVTGTLHLYLYLVLIKPLHNYLFDVYWTVLHCDNRRIKTNWMPLIILLYFLQGQHVSDATMPIIRSTILINTNNTSNYQSTNETHHTNRTLGHHTQQNTTITTHNRTLRSPHTTEHYDHHTQQNTTITTHNRTLRSPHTT